MELHQIPQADLLDILFEGRNKSYGAYELRKTYDRRLRNALLLTLSACLVVAGIYALAGIWRKPVLTTRPSVIDDTIMAIPQDKNIALPPLRPPASRPQLPQMAMSNDMPPRIVKDEDVKNDRPIPTQEELDHTLLGTTTMAGSPDEGLAPAPPSDAIGKGILIAPGSKEDIEKAFIPVETPPAYPLGKDAWIRFLQRNYHTPPEALDKGIQGTVVVAFIVDIEGNVSDVHALNGPAELQAEAIRVIKKSGKWNPAIQNGRKVKSLMAQPIVVSVQNGDE